MNWLISLFLLFSVDWFYYPVSWEYLLGSKILAVALALQAGYSVSSSFRNKSIFAFLAIIEWVFFIEYIIYLKITHCSLLFAVAYLIFIPFFFWVWKRGYDTKSNEYNKDNIFILLLKPPKKYNLFTVIRLYFGLPVLSVCIVSRENVYAFRKSSGLYSSSKFSEKWADSHILIDTEIRCTDKIDNELNKIIGTNRKPYIKCIFVIRRVLRLLGANYRIDNIFQYIPGIYALKILDVKNKEHPICLKNSRPI